MSVIRKIYHLAAPKGLRRKLRLFKLKVRIRLLYYEILRYYKRVGPSQYDQEVQVLAQLGKLIPFPYLRNNQTCLNQPIAGFEDSLNLPFVVHNGKRLYFPRHYTVTEATEEYLNYIAYENLLDLNFLEKRPHQYINESFFVKEGDVLFDVGAAEGLFTLHAIDKIKKGYLIEPEKLWHDPLRATFEPYKEKIEIIDKFASDKDSASEIALDSCPTGDQGNVFVKIDVEGYERSVLSGANQLLHGKGDIRVACCTYHNEEDATAFEEFFKGIGYRTHFSEGYVLFYYDERLQPPYFRKGLIRATGPSCSLL